MRALPVSWFHAPSFSAADSLSGGEPLISSRCLVSGSDLASLLAAVIRLCARFDASYGAEATGASITGRGAEPAYWILASQATMNQSDVARATGSCPSLRQEFLHRIHIKYRETLQDIIQFAANLHLEYTTYKPLVVVMHGLDKMTDASVASVVPVGPSGASHKGNRLLQTVEPLLCRALAIMRDALEQHAARTGSPYIVCGTVYGEDAGSEPPRYYYIVSRWLEDVFVCHADGVVVKGVSPTGEGYT
jgi:hypothetical protein